jgi:hypothetical protein
VVKLEKLATRPLRAACKQTNKQTFSKIFLTNFLTSYFTPVPALVSGSRSV